jgi:hypothetical protein
MFSSTVPAAPPAPAGASAFVCVDLSPPESTHDGRSYKPLFAFYVEDLDGR